MIVNLAEHRRITSANDIILNLRSLDSIGELFGTVSQHDLISGLYRLLSTKTFGSFHIKLNAKYLYKKSMDFRVLKYHFPYNCLKKLAKSLKRLNGAFN